MEKGFVFRILCELVRLFVRRPRLAGMGRLVPGAPAMIAANHEGAWGPVVTQAWLPFAAAPWVNAEITAKVNCRRYLATFFFMRQVKMPAWLAWPLGFVLEPLLLHLLCSCRAVPVYFNGAQAAATFKISLRRLMEGHVLIVFPDDAEVSVPGDLPGFRNGYLAAAKLYYEKTGERLPIYPMCLSLKKNLIALGEPVVFDPDNVFEAECGRINALLLDFIRHRH